MGQIICDICGEVFDSKKIKANHIRWKHKKTTFTDEQLEKSKQRLLKTNEKLYGKYLLETVKCTTCNKEFEIKYRENKRKEKYYCSRSCANTRQHSKETKEKMSLKSKELWNNEIYANKCIDNCKKGNAKKFFSSKSERKLIAALQSDFPDELWTPGGGIKVKGVRLQRDCFSKLKKVIIEVDGIWHFKDIHGQLLQKQLKDSLLNEWAFENNCKLIRIKEEHLSRSFDKWYSVIKSKINNDEMYVELY